MMKLCKAEAAKREKPKRLVISGDPKDNWYIAWSPANETLAAEGTWEDWVQLAESILNEDEKRRPGILDRDMA